MKPHQCGLSRHNYRDDSGTTSSRVRDDGTNLPINVNDFQLSRGTMLGTMDVKNPFIVPSSHTLKCGTGTDGRGLGGTYDERTRHVQVHSRPTL